VSSPHSTALESSGTAPEIVGSNVALDGHDLVTTPGWTADSSSRDGATLPRAPPWEGRTNPYSDPG